MAVGVGALRDQRALLQAEFESQHNEEMHSKHHENAPRVAEGENSTRYGTGNHLVAENK